jgi:DNA-binding transcriptional MerR regulator
MLIGELSARSGVSPRSLRYYEQEGLLDADRAANGYREYPEEAVTRAATIHSLFGMGFPRDVVTAVLGCTGEAPLQAHDRLVAQLEQVDADLERRIDEMTRTRDAVVGFLASRRTPSPR